MPLQLVQTSLRGKTLNGEALKPTARCELARRRSEQAPA